MITFGHHANAMTHGSVHMFWSMETNVRSLAHLDKRVIRRRVIICVADCNGQPSHHHTQTQRPTDGIVSRFALNVLNPNDFSVSVI